MTKRIRVPLLSGTPSWRASLFAGLAGSILVASPLSAQFTLKANNQDPLTQASSWVDGIVPDSSLIAVWDNTVTGPNTVSLPETATWRGIQILDPGGDVSLSGADLIFGSGGIDLSAATRNLQLGNGIDYMESQRIRVGPGRALNLTGGSTRRGAVGLDFDIDPTGTVAATFQHWPDDFLMAGTYPSAQLFGVHNGTDFAASTTSNIVPGFDEWPTDYTPNPAADPPNLPGTDSEFTFLMDFNNDATYGARASGNRGVFNLRFNQPNTNFDEWLVDTASAGRVITISSILVTENVGPQNVRFGGPGVVRISNVSGGLLIFQHNTAGDLVIDSTSLSAQGGTRTLTKLGPGTAIISSAAEYGGATAVHEGILRFTGPLLSPTHGVTVHSEGNLDLEGASLSVAELNVREGGLVTGRGSVTGNVTNEGDVRIVGSGHRLVLEGDVVNHGLLLVDDGAYLEINGTFTNTGVLDYRTGYATLPAGYVNEGTVLEGQDGQPPPALTELRVSEIFIENDTVNITVPSVVGFGFTLERSFTLREPTIDHTVITTAAGNGADTTLANDGQRGPDTNHGASGVMWVRNYATVREQVALMRFDVSQFGEDHLLDEATLSLFFTGSKRTRTFEVWGVTDETLDNWIESGEGGVTYNTFAGFLAADLGNKVVNEAAMTQLGTFQVVNISGQVYSTAKDSVPLGDFLRSSTDGLVSLVVFMTGTDSNATYDIASKENTGIGSPHALTGTTLIPPTLTVPTAASLEDRSKYDPWVQIGPAQSGTGEMLTFTDPVVADADSVFYRVLASEE